MAWEKQDKAAVGLAVAACGALAVYMLVTPGMAINAVTYVLTSPVRLLGLNDPNSTFYLPPPQREPGAPPVTGEYTLDTMPRAPSLPGAQGQQQQPPVASTAPPPKTALEKQRDLYETFKKINAPPQDSAVLGSRRI